MMSGFALLGVFTFWSSRRLRGSFDYDSLYLGRAGKLNQGRAAKSVCSARCQFDAEWAFIDDKSLRVKKRYLRNTANVLIRGVLELDLVGPTPPDVVLLHYFGFKVYEL
jgi:hypothetical protein